MDGLLIAFSHAIMISAFVSMMMIIIEYLNILSQGLWQKGLRGGRWKQYFLASFLGATPGCLGAFAAVSLFTHREISLGALVAAMIATSGDESFIMMSMIPEQAFLFFALLLVIGIVAGVVTDKLFPEKKVEVAVCNHQFDVHKKQNCHCFVWSEFVQHWRHCTLARVITSASLILFLFVVMAGVLGPQSWNWIRITLIVITTIALFIVVTVPNHFLEKHLWNHVIKVHLPKIFLWTFGTLFFIHILLNQLHIEDWLQNNYLIILLVACLVGLIPESGPHLVFLTLYAEGTIPLSIFLASSIVQDGHGMLPMLSESKVIFFKVKMINLALGLILGLAGYFSGW